MTVGTTDQFTLLHRQWAGRIFNHFRRLSWTVDDAADLTSEVFATALTQLPALRDPGRAGAWLWSIAHNHSVSKARAEKRRARREEVAVSESAAPSGVSPATSHRLGRALGTLDDGDRQLLLWREYSGLTYKEIAALTGKSEDSVRTGLYRARLRLREEYQKRWE